MAAAAPGDPKKAIKPAVQKRAVAINVQRSDLPGLGWTSKPPSPSSDTSPRCSYYNPDQSDLTENADADSRDFSLPTGQRVSSATSIFVSASQGKTAYARVVRPELPRCLAELFKKGTGHPNQVAILSSGRLAFPKLADETDAFRVAALFKPSPGQNVPVYLDLVTLNHGKVDTALFFISIGRSLPASFEQGVARKVAKRVHAVS